MKKYCDLCKIEHECKPFVDHRFRNHWIGRKWESDIEDEEGMIVGTNVKWEPITWWDCKITKNNISLFILNVHYSIWWGYKNIYVDGIIPGEHITPLINTFASLKPYFSGIMGMGEYMEKINAVHRKAKPSVKTGEETLDT